MYSVKELSNFGIKANIISTKMYNLFILIIFATIENLVSFIVDWVP